MSQFSRSHSVLDRRKLAAVLALTTSATDGEALAAVRAANRMLAAAGVTWADVLADAGCPFVAPERPDAPVYSPLGVALYPPIGGRWLETIDYLLLVLQHAGNLRDAHWLRTLPTRLSARPLRYDEASRLVELHRALMPAPKVWTPT